MLICDEYLALRAIALGRPADMPIDQPLAITASTWWRILRPVHNVIAHRARGTADERPGSLTTILAALSDKDLETLRNPNTYAIEVLDSRRFLDTAAAIGHDHRGGLLQLESLAAAVVHNADLWFGRHQNLTQQMRAAAQDLGVDVTLVANAPK